VELGVVVGTVEGEVIGIVVLEPGGVDPPTEEEPPEEEPFKQALSAGYGN
jgi:hypothetical protein